MSPSSVIPSYVAATMKGADISVDTSMAITARSGTEDSKGRDSL